MFVAQNESKWSVVTKAMKYMTAMTYGGGGLLLKEVPMRRMKLPLAKDGSLLRGKVDWVSARLSGVMRLVLLGQDLDLRQVLQLK